ncbi:MAG TPA: TlpA disulfide reductase family protein [Pyrinomonadaceae bacterium]|jgi:peroxiredoxin
MKKIPLLILLVLVSSIYASPSNARWTAGDDEQEISINLKGIDGKKYDTSKMRGSFLLISFGATWCGPCHEELRDLEILHKEFKDRPIQFLWVSVDDKEQMSDKELRKFAESLSFTFPVLRDPEKHAYKQFSERTRLPLVVILDKQGHIVPPNQFGASSQPGYFRINLRNRLKQLFMEDAEANSTSAE